MDTAAPAPPAATRPARARLLEAAEALFYEEGINTVGIDRIIERAGVAKASLYDVFGSKEELVRAYLTERFEKRKARYTARLARYRTPRERLLGVYDALGDITSDAAFRGCPFQRASVELRETSPARKVCDESRAWTLELFTRLAKEAGAAQPKKLARQLLMLYDGAVTAAQMDGEANAAAAAKALAASLVDAATR
jgi:AcrR family transcriptional regulator